MEQLPRFVAQGKTELVCKLCKSRYGLQQSPCAWFGHFSTIVQAFSMIKSEANHSVFYRCHSPDRCIYLIVYVDDIIIIGNDFVGIEAISILQFQTNDLGKL